MEQLRPMLAVAAEPFDSPDYLFEVKWDGVRALASIDSGCWQLWGRAQSGYTARYPELSVLQQLPEGTILDGELVHLTEGRADFRKLLRRHQLVSPAKIRRSAAQEPVSYMVFDLLQLAGRCLLSQPLQQRRGQLQQLLSAGQPRLMFSQGVIAAGQQFFQEVIQQGHEGVMAKHLESSYRPGKRASQWRKIKPREQVVCVIIGYQIVHGRLDRLLLAAQHAGHLQYVGSVSSGLTESLRSQLQPLLADRACARPIIAAPESAHWVRPDLYCQVACFGFTPEGRLRFPYVQRLFPLATASS